MDTPERNQIGTPISKFEDSPVFNYINSLSPIKPVKSIHVTQTFNSLSFAALPSVFTSPHVSTNREFRFLRRHNLSDLCKSENSSDNGNKFSANEGVTDAVRLSDNSAEPLETFDPGSSLGEASFESHNEHPKLAIELSRTLNFDCGSPDCNPPPCSGVGTDSVLELVGSGTSASLVPCVQDAMDKGSLEGEVHLQGICQTKQKTEQTGCDWESLISDAADLLIFNSPNGTETFPGLIQKSIDPVISGEQHETEDPSSELKERDWTRDNLADTFLNNCMTSHRSEKIDSKAGKCIPFTYKPVSNLHRGVRRRCLVFEVTGAHRKNLDNASDIGSSGLSQSNGNIAYNDKQLVPIKPGSDSSRCILPGIGLHLNALATTSKEHKIVKHESVASVSQLMSGPSSTASFHSSSTSQEPINNSLALTSSERDMDPTESGIHVVEDISQASVYVASEEFNQSSPKKKRRRLDHAGESEGCKRCNCKKSKCLKLYCECFAAGVYCVEPCSCQECFNKPLHEDTVLATRKQIESRNPLAFAPKVIRSSDSIAEIGDESNKTPASARHKRGCNCKKSNCLKKYCECYQGGVGCSINCRCEGCKNAFGRKDGSAPLGTEAEPEEEEPETGEKSAVDQGLQKAVVQNDEEENPDSALPITPVQICRPSVQLPFSLRSKPPRSSFLSIGSSSGLHISERLGKPNFLRPQPKFEKHFQTVLDDEMPDILRGNGSPSSGVKAASPNSKRVSPPHCDFGASPGRRSGRKLILQSIPSFPSLTPQN